MVFDLRMLRGGERRGDEGFVWEVVGERER